MSNIAQFFARNPYSHMLILAIILMVILPLSLMAVFSGEEASSLRNIAMQ